MAGPHGFVKIMHLYLRTADIWICWFARFAFVKPSCLHLRANQQIHTHNKKVLEAHEKVLEAHKIVLEAHKTFRFSSISWTFS